LYVLIYLQKRIEKEEEKGENYQARIRLSKELKVNIVRNADLGTHLIFFIKILVLGMVLLRYVEFVQELRPRSGDKTIKAGLYGRYRRGAEI
jgi:hypothetical protein